MSEELEKKIANILLQEIEGGFCNVPKMQKFNIAARAIVKYLHPKDEQQPEGNIPLEIDQIFSKNASDFVKGLKVADINPSAVAYLGYYEGRATEYFSGLSKIGEERVKKEFFERVAAKVIAEADGHLATISSLQAEIQTLRKWLEGEAQANRNIVDQNCSLLDERDRSNASFKKMNDLFDLKIQESKDYRKVLEEGAEAEDPHSVECFWIAINDVLAKYPSTPTNTTEK